MLNWVSFELFLMFWWGSCSSPLPFTDWGRDQWADGMTGSSEASQIRPGKKKAILSDMRLVHLSRNLNLASRQQLRLVPDTPDQSSTNEKIPNTTATNIKHIGFYSNHLELL